MHLGPTSRRVLPPVEYDRKYRQEASDVVFFHYYFGHVIGGNDVQSLKIRDLN